MIRAIPVAIFLFATLSTVPNVDAIKEKDLVWFVQQVFDHVTPLSVPDFNFATLNLYANATNIQLSRFTLVDLQLTIPDAKHMLFNLSGLSGHIDLDLDAGITGPIPIHRKDHVKGKFEDMSLAITFEVKDGNAMMSKVKPVIGKMSLDFGKDELANLLAKLFMPVFKATVEDAIPALILVMKHDLDFQHLMALLLKGIPKLPLPNATFSLEGYDLQIENVRIDDATALRQIFSIQKKNELVFETDGLEGTGYFTLLVGKVGMEKQAKVTVNLHNTLIYVVSKVVGQAKKGDLEIDYVSSKQDIGSLSLVTQSTDPIIVWLVDTLQPTVKSLLEEGFEFLIRTIFNL